MSKSTKMIAALGIVAGLGVAALPLGAVSAATCPDDAANPASGQSPQCSNATVTLTVTDGVSIALQNAPITFATAGDNTTTISSVGEATTAAAITTSAIAGGPIVAAGNATVVTTAGSTAYSLTAAPNPLSKDSTVTGNTADGTIAFSGEALSTQNPNASVYGILFADASTTASTAPSTVYTGSSAKMVDGATTKKITNTAYRFAVNESQKAGTYTGTVTYTVAVDGA